MRRSLALQHPSGDLARLVASGRAFGARTPLLALLVSYLSYLLVFFELFS
jgi:hypothetical protein